MDVCFENILNALALGINITHTGEFWHRCLIILKVKTNFVCCFNKQGVLIRTSEYSNEFIERQFYRRTVHFDNDISSISEIAHALTLKEIQKDWQWLTEHLFHVLNEMEIEDEVTNFTICKIESLVAHTASTVTDDIKDSGSFGVVVAKFRERFPMAVNERLVNHYSCK